MPKLSHYSPKALAMAMWQRMQIIGRVAKTDPASAKISPMVGFSIVDVQLIPKGGRSNVGKPPTMFPVRINVGEVA